MIQRRELLAASLAMATISGSGVVAKTPKRRFDAGKRFRELELGNARLGVCLFDTQSGEYTGNRIDEHFAMCSTFKLALVAAFLREADAGNLSLSEMLPVTMSDLLEWAPITREHVAAGKISIGACAQAAQEFSDGTAANLLIRRLGGPAAVTAKFRAMGDMHTRLDRYEPMLGLVLSADMRDTTTPLAMAQLVRRILTGDLLKPTSRALLLGWMKNTKTGSKRIRAGIPAQWPSGDKTGTGRATGTTNKCNDVAIVFPPEKAPVIISAYYDSGEYTDQIEDRHQAVLADVGRIAADWVNS